MPTVAGASLLGLATVGLLLGMRHALEPDHLAAVSTLVADRRSRGALRLGALWGVGHTLAILGLGGGLLLLRAGLPDRVAAGLEFLVALMLMALGLRGLWSAWRQGKQGPALVHAHRGRPHLHGGPAEHAHLGPLVLALRPLAVGLIHGLAGTGALTALVLASLPNFWSGFAYLLTFGAGSLLGMACITGLAGATLANLRSLRIQALLRAGTGLVSLALGIYWGAEQLGRLR